MNLPGYHGPANVVDDNILGLITNSIAQMQMANNANVQVLNDNISPITTKMRDLRNTLLATQQQLTMVFVDQHVPLPVLAASTPTPVYA